MSLTWRTVRTVETRRAVWLDEENAEAVAAHFGGSVEVVRGARGRQVTRVKIGNTSGPVGFWLTDDARWLREDEWEEMPMVDEPNVHGHAVEALRALDERTDTAFVAWSLDTDPGTVRTPPALTPTNESRATAVLAAVADHPGLVEVLARALYEEQRATVPADDPMLALVGVPWAQASKLVREHWITTMRPVADAARAWLRGAP